MAEQGDEKRMDEMLDSLLAAWSDVEPRPGLETRLIAQLRAEAETKTARHPMFFWLWTSSAVAALAMVLIAVYVLRPGDMPQPPTIPVASIPVLPVEVPANGHNPTVKESRPPAITVEPAVIAEDVRKEVFPTPSPLSPQEELLVRYLARTPREEVAAQSHMDEPPPDAVEQLVPESRHFSGTELHSTQ
jgi:hypothetical protein